MILAHNHSKRGQEPSGTLETILNILLTHNHPKRGQEPSGTIESILKWFLSGYVYN